MNDRITRTLQALAPHLLTINPLGVRAILEDMHDGAQDDLFDDLICTADAAAIWDISRQAAHAHIARLHARYSYGRLIGGVWIIRRAHVMSSPPERKYRARRTERN